MLFIRVLMFSRCWSKKEKEAPRRPEIFFGIAIKRHKYLFDKIFYWKFILRQFKALSKPQVGRSNCRKNLHILHFMLRITIGTKKQRRFNDNSRALITFMKCALLVFVSFVLLVQPLHHLAQSKAEFSLIHSRQSL